VIVLLKDTNKRTIVSAMGPSRFQDDLTLVFLKKVWFEELSEPVSFVADIMDGEEHGRELWFRAMKGEYGPMEIILMDFKDFRKARETGAA